MRNLFVMFSNLINQEFDTNILEFDYYLISYKNLRRG